MAWTWVVAGLILAGATVGVLSFTPLPGHCTIVENVTFTELSLVVGVEYSIGPVILQSTTQSKVLDWGGWFPSGSFVGFSWYSKLTATVTTGSGQSASKVEVQALPSVPFVNGASYSASDTFTLAQVPTGPATVTVTLYNNGALIPLGNGQQAGGYTSQQIVGC